MSVRRCYLPFPLVTSPDVGAKVSVIIPTYNRADLLRWSVASVLAQTERDIEVLVVDDGSTDSTPQWLAEASRRDDRIRVFSQNHLGAQTARNLALDASTGVYVSFLDDDDLWHPSKLVAQLAQFDADPTLDGAICQTVWFHEWPGDHNFLFNRFGGDPLERFLLLDVVWQTAAPLWKRSFLDRVGPWDVRLTSGQDLDFHTRCLCHSPKLAFSEDVLNFFREHPGTRITRARREEHAANTLVAMQNAAELLRTLGPTVDRASALASTVMRQSRNLAFQGEIGLSDACLRLALDTHPSKQARSMIRKFLRPLNRLTAKAGGGPVAKALRRISHHVMLASGLERKRPLWWQRYPFDEEDAIARWAQELDRIREIAG